MTTIATSTYTPAPGHETEAEALMKEGLELMKKHGAKGYVARLASGGMQNTLTLFLEFENDAAYGAALDHAYASTESQKLIERGRQAAVLVPAGAADYAEIPGFEVPYDAIRSQGVIAIGSYRIHHGKHAQVHEWMKEGKELNDARGVKTRVMQSRASDPDGVTATVGYYRNFAEWSSHCAALQNDPAYKAYGEKVAKHPPHADFLHAKVMQII